MPARCAVASLELAFTEEDSGMHNVLTMPRGKPVMPTLYMREQKGSRESLGKPAPVTGNCSGDAYLAFASPL